MVWLLCRKMGGTEAVVSQWSGEQLEMHQNGRAAQQLFRQQVRHHDCLPFSPFSGVCLWSQHPCLERIVAPSSPRESTLMSCVGRLWRTAGDAKCVGVQATTLLVCVCGRSQQAGLHSDCSESRCVCVFKMSGCKAGLLCQGLSDLFSLLSCEAFLCWYP